MNPEQAYKELNRQCRVDYAQRAVESPQELTRLYAHCEELLDHFHPDRAERLDCQAGCGDCCIVNVSVLWPEALAITEYVERTPGFELDSLAARLNELWTRVRGVDDEDRVCMRQPCVFLDVAGNCTIYPVRPLLCRSITSTDASGCRESFNAYLHNEKCTVEMNLFQKELYDTAYLGLSEGLETRNLDGRGFEMTGLLRYLQKNRDGRSLFSRGERLSWKDLA